MIGGCDRDARTLRLLMLILIMKRLLGMRRPKLNFPAAAAAMVTRFVDDASTKQQRCQTRTHTRWRPGGFGSQAPLKASKNFEGQKTRARGEPAKTELGRTPSFPGLRRCCQRGIANGGAASSSRHRPIRHEPEGLKGGVGGSHTHRMATHEHGHGHGHGNAHGHNLDGEGLTEEAWLELFYDLLYVAAMLKLGTCVKTAEWKTVTFGGIIFAILWTTWYQLQRYLSRFHKNDLIHLYLLFFQCASVAQICINLIPLKEMKKEFFEAHNISRGVLLSKFTILIMLVKAATQSKLKLRQVKIEAIALVVVLALHAVALFIKDTYQIFYFWIAAMGVQMAADFVSKVFYENNDRHRYEHHDSERLGCFTMVVLGESVVQLLLPDVEKVSSKAVQRYAVLGLSGLLVFNLAVLHFDKLPSKLHRKSESERGASSLPPSETINYVLWTYIHYPMTYAMLLVGVSMKYMFDVDKSSDETVWMMASSVTVTLMCFTVMRFVRQGFKGKQKRLVTYALRFIHAVVCGIVPFVLKSFNDITEMDAYQTVLPFTVLTTLLMIVDMMGHINIVKKVEERERMNTMYLPAKHMVKQSQEASLWDMLDGGDYGGDDQANGTGNGTRLESVNPMHTPDYNQAYQ